MSLAQTIQSMWPFRGVPDPRSNREIDDDLEAEFAFHLEQSSRDLIEQGCDRLAADRTARERFGDLERYKKQCRQIALKERIMLQRVNFVMMIVVMLMVVGVGVQVMLTQKHNTMALQDITTQIAKMRLDAAAEARERGWGAPGSDATSEPVTATVEYPPAGEWHQIDATSRESVANGGQILVVASDDIRNLGDGAYGVAKLPGLDSEVELRFSALTWKPHNLVIRADINGTRRQSIGKWDFDSDGHLRLNLSTASSQIDSPVIFKRVGDGHEVNARLTAVMNRFNVAPTKLPAPEPSVQPGDERSKSGFIYIDGDIARPGVYALPQVGTLTLMRFFAAAGVPTDKDFEIVVSRLENSKPAIHSLTMQELRDSPEKDMTLFTDDRVLLRTITATQSSLTAAMAPAAPQVTAEAPPDPALRSPFRGVKWADWTPYVDVQTQWYELLTVDGIPISLLLDHCRNTQADNPRACFSERLAEALAALGRPVGDAMKLELRDPATGTRLSIDQAAMTAQNHERVVALNKSAAAAGDQFPKYEQSPPSQ